LRGLGNADRLTLACAKHFSISAANSRRSKIYLVYLNSKTSDAAPSTTYSVAAFVVNSEPHTGARPSVRVCVGP
jgi:hypothetical protein